MMNIRHGEVCFSHRGHAAAVSLLRLANLDPLRTTAEEFDKMQLRFFCGYCDSNQSQGIKVMNWRECVSVLFFRGQSGFESRSQYLHITVYQVYHFSKASFSTHESPYWNLLAPEMTLKYIIPAEPILDRELWRSWACNHCSEYHDVLVSHLHIRRHVIIV
jgi:hypothetical protein